MNALSISVIVTLCTMGAVLCAEVSSGTKQLPMPGESLVFDGHECFLILPENAAPGTPWVWYAPTLKGLPSEQEVWMFRQFLAKGIAIAGIDIGESYGSPEGRKIYADHYAYLTGKREFSRKPVLLARSRGGLMLYSWAAENPGSVAAIAGIYPVCDIASYPGLARAAGAYHMTAEELEGKLDEHNPIARLAPLAGAKVPILHIHGDSDKVVPLNANSAELVKRYKALGGSAQLEVVPGGGHDLNPAWFQSRQLADFIISQALRGAEGGGTIR